jgi:uncharacterized protein with GYD domain
LRYVHSAYATLHDAVRLHPGGLGSPRRHPEDRSAPVRELTESMGGRLIGWYLSMGDYDGLLIYEAPDDATAGAAVLAAARPGHLRATKTTPLFSVEESMEIMRRAGGTPFRAPGQ